MKCPECRAPIGSKEQKFLNELSRCSNCMAVMMVHSETLNGNHSDGAQLELAFVVRDRKGVDDESPKVSPGRYAAVLGRPQESGRNGEEAAICAPPPASDCPGEAWRGRRVVGSRATDNPRPSNRRSATGSVQ